MGDSQVAGIRHPKRSNVSSEQPKHMQAPNHCGKSKGTTEVIKCILSVLACELKKIYRILSQGVHDMTICAKYTI